MAVVCGYDNSGGDESSLPLSPLNPSAPPPRRVQSQCRTATPPHLSAPTLSQHLEKHSPSSSKRHSSISVMAGRTEESLTVAMEMKQENTAVRFQCNGKSVVHLGGADMYTYTCICTDSSIPLSQDVHVLSGEFEVSIHFVQ